MENYNIYDEIGRGTHSFVYKARRKRSIEYVAVKSTAKSRMDKILNEVPFLHKLESPYVLKFFDWYESSNHIWLILEYCMGGDLLNLITQDKQLPESAVQSFGIELVAGLQYLHSNSILYCDLKPANILIDEFGSLKLADFGLARRIPGSDAAPVRPLAPGSPHYMAPELFQQPAVHSFASDFWALGCVLYELRTGRQPFTHTNFSELARRIQSETVEFPVPGCEMSPAFCKLLERLLVKDPYQRITWDELVVHPFWDGLPRIQNVVMPPQEIFDRNSPVCEQVTSNDGSNGLDNPEEPHDNGHISEREKDRDNGDSSLANADDVGGLHVNGIEETTTGNNCNDETHFSDSGDSDADQTPNEATRLDITSRATHDDVRPVSAPNSRIRALPDNNEDLNDDQNGVLNEVSQLTDIRHRWRAAHAPHSAPPAIRNAPKRRISINNLFDRSGVPGSGLRKISKLVFTAADCRVKSIIGNKNVQIEDLPQVRADLFRFPLLAPENLLSCSAEALENQLKEIYISLKFSHSDDQAKLSVMAYLFSLSCHARLAHVIVNSSILKLLIRMLSHEARLATPNKTVISMLCLVLGVLFRFATFIAPSSPDQLQVLVKLLLEVIVRPDGLENKNSTDIQGLQPRPLALACLGELLFYISTQQEWELPMEGVDTVLACIGDTNVVLRYYAVRTLGNMLIQCTDSLLSRLISEKIVLTLMRGLLQHATSVSEDENGELNVAIALRTATTEALAQVLRHVRTPSSTASLSSRLKRSIMLFFAKPDILNAVWRGVESMKESTELAIASLNIINSFLDMKLGTEREAEAAAIKSSRTLLLERVVAFPTICKVLEIDTSTRGDDVDDDSLSTLRAKGLIMIHLGVQLNRSFLLSFVQYESLNIVEKVIDPIADQLCEDENNPGSISPEKKLSAFEMYLAQCAMNVCKLSIRMALKLGAVCFSTPENGDGEITSSNNTENRSPRISPIPFQLFGGLLHNPNCRQQLLNYFVANDSKQYTFFLRLMAKLLTSFPDEILVIPGSTDKTTVARYVSEILVDLFELAAKETNDIVLVEKQMLFTQLLPAIVKHVNGESEGAAVNCLRILHVVLLDFDYDDDNGDYEFFDPFVRSILFPHLNTLFRSPMGVVEDVWSLSSELMFGLLSSDSSLLGEVEDLNIVPTVMNLLQVPDEFQSLPSHATQLVQMLLDSADVRSELLYESGITRSVVTGLIFASKHKEQDGNLLDLSIILLNLLHHQFEKNRQSGRSPAPAGFHELVACGPLMLQFCTSSDVDRKMNGHSEYVAPEKDTAKSRTNDELADVASRCLVFLSQIFGEQLNGVFFSQSKNVPSGFNDSDLSSLSRCLEGNMNGIILLRVLHTLKTCLRCETKRYQVSNWFAEHRNVLSTVEALATQKQTSRLDGAVSEAENHPNRPSIGEQISKTAASIMRLCRTTDVR
ncbi:ULK/ULK protein kinase [Phytophthora nicotianae CJ01A1]|uniref:ULK/ULK protein kinase n=2 Tax=Phytophthora nicotianae TaxID=4792 RepID=W2XBM2_PHYNI|nr:ULK/ULK protein kinase [Phytophthora nicotianae]ETP20235.1 ULK/ULK protein kinase [Phytophthora nicotianae CJ01A1]